MSENYTSLIEKLRLTSFSDVSISNVNDYPCVEIPKEKLLEAANVFKNQLGYDLLIDLVGVDRYTKENRFEVIYNLSSIKNKERLFIRVKLDSKKPELESVTGLWKTADWEEREVYDMFGIIFLNHPDLRRIYMMDEFDHFPLRKDFPLMGIPGSILLPKK